MKLLFKNINALLSMDNGFEIKKTDVCVEDDRIAYVGIKPECFIADKTFDGTDKLLMPGFINSHTHCYMSLLRNCADDLIFDEWLFNNILPLEAKLMPEDSYWGTLLGISEMIRTGTTSFLDMYIVKDEVTRAVYDSGMRAVLSRGLVGESRNDEGGKQRLSEAVDEIKAWNGKGDGRLTFMLAPHAPYTCGADYIDLILSKASELGTGIHTHISEGKKETEDMAKIYGMTSTEYLEKTGMFKFHTLAAHCVYLTDGDMDIIAENGVSIATNPVSNLKLANGIARVPDMMKRGINVSLGTDGAASNNTLNLFKDLSFLTLLQKGLNKDPLSISAAQGIKCATINGARALGYTDIGEIKEGMKADLCVLDLNSPSLYPNNNIVSSLAYSASGYETETVLVNGQILMENRQMKTIDEEQVRYEVKRICKRVGLA